MVKIDTAKKFFPTTVLDKLLIVGEKNVDFVEFELDRFYNGIDLSTAIFTLLANIQTYSVAQILSKAVTDTTITLKWTIDENFTAVQGEMSLEIKAITDTEVFKCLSSRSFHILSGNSLGAVPPQPILDVLTNELADHETRIGAIEESGGSGYTLPTSSTTVKGGIKVDGITITVDENGVAQAVGGGGGGTDGKQVELQKSATYIQWRYVGDTIWINLVTLADITGAKGEQGQQGSQGIQGPKGDTGLTGAKGDTGVTGSQGIQGIQGIKGDKGEKGDQGIQGVKGNTGDQGIQGEKGNAFTYSDFTAEQLVALKGAKGEQGLQGEKGDKGDTGLQGLQGIQGEKGDTGAQGQAGTNGTTPVKGTDYFTQADIDSLGIKPLQVTVTSAAPTITLADNTMFTCTTTLTSFTIPAPTGNISCQIDFNSGTTATNNIIISAAFKLTGANVTNNVFTPVANKHYTLSIFTSNGVYYMIVGAF